MPEKTKRKKADSENEAEKKRGEKKETNGENDLSKDQREKSYYYDDAYGYKTYNPDDEDDAENC